MAVTGLPQLPEGMKWHVEFEKPVLSISQPGTWSAVGHVSVLQYNGAVEGRGTFTAMSWEEPAVIEQKLWHVAKNIITRELTRNIEARKSFEVLLEDLSGDYPPNTLIKAL